jgi:hypothetical protein
MDSAVVLSNPVGRRSETDRLDSALGEGYSRRLSST